MSSPPPVQDAPNAPLSGAVISPAAHCAALQTRGSQSGNGAGTSGLADSRPAVKRATPSLLPPGRALPPRGQQQRGRDRRLNASASEAVRTICHVEKQLQQRHRPHGGRAHLGSAQPRRAPRRAPVSPSPTFSSSTVWLNRMAFSASTVNWMGQVVSSSSPRSSAPELLRSV